MAKLPEHILNGRLGPEKISKIEQWLSKHNLRCPACNSDEWNLGEYLTSTPAVVGASINEEYSYIFVMLESDCGYVTLLSADVLAVNPFRTESTDG
jgi:hypothetical protein